MTITVTKPFLPPQDEYNLYLKEIWKRNWLTNNGPLVNELELKIKNYLGCDHFLFLSNGTIALQLAIKALEISGEVITTPFSYVATTSSIVWENCTPVFVDIDPNTFNIDPKKIENAITERTSAILATHVYGNPCDVEAIGCLANRHNLKVIYDGAHAFGTCLNDNSLFNYGDISTASFHATKLFHTIEGGGVFTSSPDLLRTMSLMRNFGHDGPFIFSDIGINGKNSEFHAAMGLCNLKYIDRIIEKRKADSLYYDNWLLNDLDLRKQTIAENVTYNYSYYPILFETEKQVLKVVKMLEDNNISPRRYFYPLLTELPYTQSEKELSNARSISQRILCLPIYYDITKEEIDMICRLIIRSIKY